MHAGWPQREWMGIEPTRDCRGSLSTALKAAGPTRCPDTPGTDTGVRMPAPGTGGSCPNPAQVSTVGPRGARNGPGTPRRRVRGSRHGVGRHFLSGGLGEPPERRYDQGVGAHRGERVDVHRLRRSRVPQAGTGCVARHFGTGARAVDRSTTRGLCNPGRSGKQAGQQVSCRSADPTVPWTTGLRHRDPRFGQRHRHQFGTLWRYSTHVRDDARQKPPASP